MTLGSKSVILSCSSSQMVARHTTNKGAVMIKTSRIVAVLVLGALLVFGNVTQTQAMGLDGVNLKGGINLTREQSVGFGGAIGGQFDSHRWIMGGSIDLGRLFIPKLHFVPGADFVVQSNVKIFVGNADFVYFFSQSPKGRGYAGAGFGTHFYRIDGAPDDTKISLNVPLGFQRKLGTGMGWFGEMKLVIADDERDSALQFAVGLSFGSFE